MKGKLLVIGTMDLEGETLTGSFIEADKSELDSRFFGADVVVKRESDYQDTIELVNELTDMLCHVEFANGDLGEETETYQRATQFLKNQRSQ